MNFVILSLAQLDSSGLDQLAVLHLPVMHTLLSDLGLPVVRRYYEICRGDPAVIGLCAVTPTQEIIGWAVGSPHPEKVNADLRQPIPWFMGQMLRLTVTRPGVLMQLAVSALSSSSPMEPGAIELTYIGVAPSARGQGLGRALLEAFVEAACAAGYRSVVLSVETDNPAAVALYTQSRFQITRTFKEGRFERHRMELFILDPTKDAGHKG